ncbi:MAG: sensor histidine kinase [Nitrosopumilaceae archaeon]|nr:sensor histidine kinase [Nitrosopumilaceae archaeon]
MQLYRISKIISTSVILVGLLVILGWILDIPILESAVPNEVTMKFSTAISFVFSGIILYFVSSQSTGKIGAGQIAIPIAGLVVFLFMVTLMVGYAIGTPSGVEQLFVKEKLESVKTSYPGMPSIPTALSFLLIVSVGIISLSNYRRSKATTYIGYAITTIGSVAIIGHLTSQPLLYYYVENLNTGMAIHTGILFALIGISLQLLKISENTVYSTIKIQTKLFCLFLASSIIPIVFIVGLNFTVTQNFDMSHTNSIIVISSVTAISVGLFSWYTARSISHPITDLKNIATRISKGDFSVKANEESSDEIGQLSKSFNQMLDSVIKAERLSTIGLLSSRLGHDLRNDLSAIMLNIQIIRKKHDLETDKELKSQLERIERSALKINSQMQDVLNFVRFSPLKTENVLLSKILQNTLKTVQVPETIKIVLPEKDISVNCNADQLEVVLTNLINNSIQAINTEGEIDVEAQEDDNESIIKIKDSGSGISEEIMPKIFDPLFTTKQKGTGLGLATCKSVIEQYHGIIEVKNNPTTFTIKIPK